MSADPPKYEISSFQDIIEKVPHDRIPVMMAELGDLLRDMAELRSLVSGLAAEELKDLPEGVMTLKLPMVWTDDHKETHTVHMLAGEQEFATLVIESGKEEP